MNIREISKPVTAKSLNESLAKKFGAKINIDAFTLEQLENARNKVRTKLSQVETNESFDTVVNDEGYQKSKLFLDVLNAAISERGPVAEAEDQNDDGKNNFDDVKIARMVASGMSKAEAIKKVNGKQSTKTESIVSEESAEASALMDAYNQMLKAGNKAGAELIKGILKTQHNVDIDSFSQIRRPEAPQNTPQDPPTSRLANESVIVEGAEDEAELVMAAKDMVDRVTGWMEDTAEMQTESMLELADAIRDEMGSEKSEMFTSTVKPALESMYAAMEVTREALTQGVGQITGEGDAPMMGMGADDLNPAMADDPPMEPPLDADDPLPTDDGMGAAPAAAGGDEEAGRARRESVERKSKKKVAEASRRIATLLSKKKS